jgi:hypothetical protein
MIVPRDLRVLPNERRRRCRYPMPWRTCKHCAITVTLRGHNKENGRTDPTTRDYGVWPRLRVRSQA